MEKCKIENCEKEVVEGEKTCQQHKEKDLNTEDSTN